MSIPFGIPDNAPNLPPGESEMVSHAQPTPSKLFKALFDLVEAVDSEVDIGNKSAAFRKRVVAARAALHQGG